MGRRRQNLLLVHVEDVAGAVLRCLQTEATRGRVFTVTSSPIKVRDYVKNCVRNSRYQRVRVIYVPYVVARAAALAGAVAKKVLGRGPSLNRRRLLSVYRNAEAASALLFQETGWRPREDLLQRLASEAQETVPSFPAAAALPAVTEEDHAASAR
jgi:nucleoside-diphosphate-sugar epimerase